MADFQKSIKKYLTCILYHFLIGNNFQKIGKVLFKKKIILLQFIIDSFLNANDDKN